MLRDVKILELETHTPGLSRLNGLTKENQTLGVDWAILYSPTHLYSPQMSALTSLSLISTALRCG